MVTQDFTATWQLGQYARYFIDLLLMARAVPGEAGRQLVGA